MDDEKIEESLLPYEEEQEPPRINVHPLLLVDKPTSFASESLRNKNKDNDLGSLPTTQTQPIDLKCVDENIEVIQTTEKIIREVEALRAKEEQEQCQCIETFEAEDNHANDNVLSSPKVLSNYEKHETPKVTKIDKAYAENKELSSLDRSEEVIYQNDDPSQEIKEKVDNELILAENNSDQNDNDRVLEQSKRDAATEKSEVHRIPNEKHFHEDEIVPKIEHEDYVIDNLPKSTTISLENNDDLIITNQEEVMNENVYFAEPEKSQGNNSEIGDNLQVIEKNDIKEVLVNALKKLEDDVKDENGDNIYSREEETVMGKENEPLQTEDLIDENQEIPPHEPLEGAEVKELVDLTTFDLNISGDNFDQVDVSLSNSKLKSIMKKSSSTLIDEEEESSCRRLGNKKVRFDPCPGEHFVYKHETSDEDVVDLINLEETAELQEQKELDDCEYLESIDPAKPSSPPSASLPEPPSSKEVDEIQREFTVIVADIITQAVDFIRPENDVFECKPKSEELENETIDSNSDMINVRLSESLSSLTRGMNPNPLHQAKKKDPTGTPFINDENIEDSLIDESEPECDIDIDDIKIEIIEKSDEEDEIRIGNETIINSSLCDREPMVIDWNGDSLIESEPLSEECMSESDSEESGTSGIGDEFQSQGVYVGTTSLVDHDKSQDTDLESSQKIPVKETEECLNLISCDEDNNYEELVKSARSSLHESIPKLKKNKISPKCPKNLKKCTQKQKNFISRMLGAIRSSFQAIFRKTYETKDTTAL